MSLQQDTYKRIAVVMAGGSGERFWPMSRWNRPKQLLKLFADEATMMEQAIQRLRGEFLPEDIYVITAEHLKGPIQEVIPDIPAANVVAEPMKRNTAGCLTYMVATLRARYGDTPISMAVVTADHLIGPEDAFQADVRAALDLAETHGGIAIIGIPPSRAETGYGYVEIEPTVIAGSVAFPAKQFHEKPNQELADEYVANGNFLWNSGMFFWTLDTFTDELAQATPAHGEVLSRLIPQLSADDAAGAARTFSDLSDISIDYALLEKASKISVVKATFSWDDLGSWDAIGRFLDTDDLGNATSGDSIVISSENTMIHNASAELTVAVSHVSNVLVIATDDAVLVVDRDHAQSVKQVVNELKARNSPKI